MKFEVYCDESRPDLLSSQKPAAQYMVIGGLWLPADQRDKPVGWGEPANPN